MTPSSVHPCCEALGECLREGELPPCQLPTSLPASVVLVCASSLRSTLFLCHCSVSSAFPVFDPLFSCAVVFRHMKDQEALLTEQWHKEKELRPQTSDLRPETQRKPTSTASSVNRLRHGFKGCGSSTAWKLAPPQAWIPWFYTSSPPTWLGSYPNENHGFPRF